MILLSNRTSVKKGKFFENLLELEAKAAVKQQYSVLAASFGREQHVKQCSEYKHCAAVAQHEGQVYSIETECEARQAGEQQNKACQQSR